MTVTRLWVDPKLGANYVFGDKLPSSDFNGFISGIRALDRALEDHMIATWTEVTMANTYAKVGYDQKWHRILGLRTMSGDTTPNVDVINPFSGAYYGMTITGPAGGWNTSFGGRPRSGVVASNSTVTLVGGVSVNATAQKIATLDSNGATWTLQSMASSAAGVGPYHLIWDPYNELFVAGMNGSGTTDIIETSPDGETWTARTVPSAHTINDIATDGSGTIVAVLNASTDKAWRSVNGGVTWSEVTMPSTTEWTCITYVPGLETWYAANGDSSGSYPGANDTYASSTGGSTWSSATYYTTYVPKALASTGNVLLAVEGYSTGDNVIASRDGLNGYTICDGSGSADPIYLFANGHFAVALGGSGDVLLSAAQF